MQPPAGRIRTARRRRAPPWSFCGGLWACLIAATLAPAAGAAVSGTGEAPSTLLLHAAIPQAREFASETARQRGWSILRSGADALTFEQAIDAEAGAGPAVLRIQASFAESPAGVTVTLRAEEVRSSTDGGAEPQDVTRRYRDNLLNALDSLASKWGLRPGAAPAAHAEPVPAPPSPPVQAAPAPGVTPAPALRSSLPEPPTTAQGPGRRIGAWAYYAERYAEGHGCALADLGAVLEGTRGGAELHRVHCADGRQIRVRCLGGDCAAAP
jgi:hypothetical protein